MQRFFPSEYGNDVDRVHAVEPVKSVYATKARIRRVIEAEGIPYTYVSSNFFAGRFLPSLAQAWIKGLPTDKVIILGDGNVKGKTDHVCLLCLPCVVLLQKISLFSTRYKLNKKKIRTHCNAYIIFFILSKTGVFATEEDVGTYTIKAVDDPRTLNKILYLRPSSNILSHNELVSLWEKKVGKTFDRVYIPEDEVLKKIQGENQPCSLKCNTYVQ